MRTAILMWLFIPHSKTDQEWEGHWIPIARTGGKYCPVALTERLIAEGHYADLGPGSLIRGVQARKGGHVLRPSGELPSEGKQPGALAYTTYLAKVKEVCTELGLDASLYGTHSARGGGATAAAELGVPDRLIKQHGRWRSDFMVQHYIRVNREHQLDVTRAFWADTSFLDSDTEDD